MKRARVEDSAPDSTTNTEGGPSEGIGFRGPLVGSTEQNRPYERHFHEIQELHSRKVKTFEFRWGLQRTKFANNGHSTGFALLPICSGSVSAANVIPGVVGFQNEALTESSIQLLSPLLNSQQGREPNGTTTEPGAPIYTTHIYARNIADYVYTNPINMLVEDFIDNKLFNFDTNNPRGLMTQYRKFRLKKFSIELEFKTYDMGTSFVNLGELNGGWVGDTPDQTVGSFISRTQRLDMDYYLYRDIYADYAVTTDFDIGCFPTESINAGNPKDQFSRAVKDVRNLDNQLTVVRNGETFKFERSVNAKGAYFLTLAQINNLGTGNIAYLVASLEAQSLDPLAITSPFPEGFSMIFAPIDPPIAVLNKAAIAWDGTTTSTQVKPVHVNCVTKVWARYLATWEAFDFNYALASLELHLTEIEHLSLMTLKDNIHRALQKGRKHLKD